MQINRKISLVNFNDRNTTPLYIVVHYVGAVSTAQNNANYFYANYRGASATYFVDETSIWQVVEDNDTAWHCGGSLYSGTPHPFYGKCKNSNSIGIEMCVKKDANGNWYFEDATVSNTIDLIKTKMKQYNIPLDRVIRHYDVTGKPCPQPLLNDNAWNAFKQRVEGASGSTPIIPEPTPETPSSGIYSGSIVDYLNSINVNSSYSNRVKLAKEYGIVNYSGTASQNIQLLNKMMNSSNNKPVVPTTPSGYTGGSIVEYLNSVNVDSSFANRAKLAVTYGIKGYAGTASQNTQLLNAMRGGQGNVPTQPSNGKLRVPTELPAGTRFWISENATHYCGSSWGVPIPQSIKKATTKYTSGGQRLQNGIATVLVNELYSYVKVGDCLVK